VLIVGAALVVTGILLVIRARTVSRALRWLRRV
jgi:hypothetical protein